MTDSGTLGATATGTTGTTSPSVNSGEQAPNSPEQTPTVNNNNVDVVVDCTRVQISEADLATLSSTDWLARWRLQDAYINALEQRLHRQEGEVSDLQQRETRQRCQLGESQQREKVLVRRLAAKEQEMHDLVLQLTELKTTSIVAPPTPTTLRSSYLDPAVNTLYTLLRGELHTAKSRLDDTQHELAAWKFTPDSNTGKRLMAKCRLLHQENEELGRMTSSGRIAMLEGELALQKGFSEEVRQSQTELESFLADLEEDVEGMQSTIMLLQQELRRCKDELQAAEKENIELQTRLIEQNRATITTANNQQQQVSSHNGVSVVTTNVSTGTIVRANGENNNSSNSEQSLPSGLTINGDLVIASNDSQQPEQTEQRTDVDADVLAQSRTKRVRRSSVLSIDYECEEDVVMDDDEDGMLVITSNGDVAMSDAE